jgi:hypothetical protein
MKEGKRMRDALSLPLGAMLVLAGMLLPGCATTGPTGPVAGDVSGNSATAAQSALGANPATAAPTGAPMRPAVDNAQGSADDSQNVPLGPIPTGPVDASTLRPMPLKVMPE